MLRLNRQYLGFAIALFLTELCIALYVHDDFIRPYVGDVLVIPLIHFSVAAVLDVQPRKLGRRVLLFAFCVEAAQYFKLVDVLGVRDNAVLRTVIGTAYSTGDLVAYVVGAWLSVWIHTWTSSRQRGEAEHSTTQPG